MSLRQFIDSYMETALWSSADDDGEPLDATFSVADIAPDMKLTVMADCVKFWSDHSDQWDDDAQAGHDFWLTRNRHGAGFWDGDYPEDVGEALTKAAHAFGECTLYVGDDNKIHMG